MRREAQAAAWGSGLVGRRLLQEAGSACGSLANSGSPVRLNKPCARGRRVLHPHQASSRTAPRAPSTSQPRAAHAARTKTHGSLTRDIATVASARRDLIHVLTKPSFNRCE